VDSFLVSTAVVAVAEIGDKTQLLALMLTCRFCRPVPILLGILIATLANHAVAAALGASAAGLISPTSQQWILGLSFLAMALWVLVPDKIEEAGGWRERFGAFGTTLVSFFLLEIGDKTQIATVALAARYEAVLWVTLGTTLGMLVANAPVVLLGRMVAGRIPLPAIRMVAAGAFLLLAIAALFEPLAALVANAFSR
jgi:putative Ca2+/H+ antiporter (TMEM165/GDT1 family)